MGEYSPHEHKPLAGYAALTAAFNTAAVAFVANQRRSRRKLPSQLPLGDFLLLAGARRS